MASLKSRLVRLIFLRRAALKRLLPRDLVLPVAGPGFSLLVRADDWAVGMRIAIKRRHEVHVTREIQACLTPGMTFVDVGANIGWFTLLAAAKVGTTGRVRAFEPSASNCELLLRSLARNGFTQVQLDEVAASDHAGVVGYCPDDSNGSLASAPTVAGAVPVRCVRLDDALAAEPRVDVIKMDIEGAEALALRGMADTLRRHRPILFLEFSAGALRLISGAEPRAFLALLRAAGYDLWVNPGHGAPTPHANDDDAIMAALPGETPADHIDLIARPRRD